jgi:NDP-sugar pyrophosphorylase family protein
LYALIIAGGRGERLRPLTDTVPKAMVPVNGQPLLAYQVEWLRREGVTDVLFLCGYLGEKIRDYFGEGSDYGIEAHYSFETAPLGRGGAVKQGFDLVESDERFVLVTNGDILTNQPISELIELHQRRGAMATMMLTPYPSQFGVVDVSEDGEIRSFVEKGTLPMWINAGVYVFDRDMEHRLPKQGDHEQTTFPALAAEGRLAGLRSSAKWMAVDGPKDLAASTKALAQSLISFN